MSNFVVMKKPFLLTACLVCITMISRAQDSELLVRSGEKGSIYLEHTVLPKEGFYSVGRLYHLNPHTIANYNKLDYNKGLNIDQVIHIPLNDSNFNQKSAKGIPVYYIVSSGDGLFKISQQHRKVSVKKLQEWNKLPNENVKEGAKLIVGYFDSKELVAYLKAHPVRREVVPATDIQTAKLETANPPAATQQVPPQSKVVTNTNTVDQPVATDKAVNADVVKENKPVVKQEPQKTEPVFAKEDNSKNITGQGYFKPYYDQQSKLNKTASVTSGIFKTTSGWQDMKYYLLIDGVTSGTIVKITNPSTNKAVFAKVLGEMNGIRQNRGLDIRISNAAAASLGIADMEKFILQINY